MHEIELRLARRGAALLGLNPMEVVKVSASYDRFFQPIKGAWGTNFLNKLPSWLGGPRAAGVREGRFQQARGWVPAQPGYFLPERVTRDVKALPRQQNIWKDIDSQNASFGDLGYGEEARWMRRQADLRRSDVNRVKLRDQKAWQEANQHDQNQTKKWWEQAPRRGDAEFNEREAVNAVRARDAADMETRLGIWRNHPTQKEWDETLNKLRSHAEYDRRKGIDSGAASRLYDMQGHYDAWKYEAGALKPRRYVYPWEK